MYLPHVVKAEDLPTYEEIRSGKSDRPQVQKLLDDPVTKRNQELGKWARRMAY
jgi:hypothetical protein